MTSSHPHIGNVLMLPGYGAQAASFQQQVLSVAQSKLIQYLPLNEISGTAAADASPRDHDATMVTPKFLERYFSDLAPALRFNGAATYVNLYSAGLAADFSGDEGTIFLVLRIYDPAIFTTSEKVVISLNAGNANNAITIAIRKAVDNQLTFTRVANGSSKEVAVSSVTSLYWLPIAITWSVANDRLRAYSGGVQQGADVTGLEAFVGSLASAGANLGAESTTGTRSKFLTGAVAHFALWSKELTPGQIAAISVLPTYAIENAIIYTETFDDEIAAPMANPLANVTLGNHVEATLLDGGKRLLVSPADYLRQEGGILINDPNGNNGMSINQVSGVGGQHGPRRRHGLTFLFKGWWVSNRASMFVQDDRSVSGFYPFNLDIGLASIGGTTGGAQQINDNGAGGGAHYQNADMALETYYDVAVNFFDVGYVALRRGPDEKWRPIWVHFLGNMAFDGTAGTVGLAAKLSATSSGSGHDRMRLDEHRAVQLPYPLDGGWWPILSFYETSFPLAAPKDAAADALLFFHFLPPGSPISGDKIGIRYRMGEGGDVDNCWEAYVEYNGSTWATKVDEIVASVRTPKGSSGTNASINELSVRVIADKHQIFKRIGTTHTPPNGDTNIVHNLSAQTAHLNNVECEVFYPVGTTLVRFAAIPAENSAWDTVIEPFFDR